MTKDLISQVRAAKQADADGRELTRPEHETSAVFVVTATAGRLSSLSHDHKKWTFVDAIRHVVITGLCMYWSALDDLTTRTAKLEKRKASAAPAIFLVHFSAGQSKEPVDLDSNGQLTY